jgi:hypothetical protein
MTTANLMPPSLAPLPGCISFHVTHPVVSPATAGSTTGYRL